MNKIKRMIERYLNSRGYYQCYIPDDAPVPEVDILEMFRAYGENEVFARFLRDLCARDKDFHFQAANDNDRFTIRGAYSRTNYFISLIKKANDKRSRK